MFEEEGRRSATLAQESVLIPSIAFILEFGTSATSHPAATRVQTRPTWLPGRLEGRNPQSNYYPGSNRGRRLSFADEFSRLVVTGRVPHTEMLPEFFQERAGDFRRRQIEGGNQSGSCFHQVRVH